MESHRRLLASLIAAFEQDMHGGLRSAFRVDHGTVLHARTQVTTCLSTPS
ncbi:hypothetical protein MFUL124B02_43185 [Myxococcus fulvus 124B02]|nr:hypothetical protein MFUL124B02_43185 [Myxococcus fulvus 124B02]